MQILRGTHDVDLEVRQPAERRQDQRLAGREHRRVGDHHGVGREELLERVWDENADPFTTTVRVTVMTLRKKLGDPGVIETVVGAGYRVPAAG